MKKDSRYVWYIADLIVFALINVIIWHFAYFKVEEALSGFTWPVIIVFALGVFRMADVITHESVTDFIRAPFMDKKTVNGEVSWIASEKGFRGFFGTLISCNACMGVWVALASFYFFVFFPVPTLAFMIIMTLTCFERFLSKIYNVLEKRR